MKTSKNGIDLIKKYEGLRLKAYRCPSGVLTIGYGHTKGVKQGMVITKLKAEQYLLDDLINFEKAVSNYVKVTINQNQFDALVSFSFNVGINAFKNSTLLRRLNKGNFTEASQEFLRWNKSNGKVLEGLSKRRKEERALFIKTNYLCNKNYKGSSISDGLRQIGEEYSFIYRKKLYIKNNGKGIYKGTTKQNEWLLQLLKSGKLEG